MSEPFVNRQSSAHESTEEKFRFGTVFVQFISVSDCLVTTAVFFQLWLIWHSLNAKSRKSRKSRKGGKNYWENTGFRSQCSSLNSLSRKLFFLGSSWLEEMAEIQATSALDT